MTPGYRGVALHQPRPVVDSLETSWRVEVLNDGRARGWVETDNGCFERRKLQAVHACRRGLHHRAREANQQLAGVICSPSAQVGQNGAIEEEGVFGSS
jgi:hypothetical protein